MRRRPLPAMKVMMRAKPLELCAAWRPRDWGSPEEEEEDLRTLKGDKSKRLSSEAIESFTLREARGTDALVEGFP